MAVTTVVDIGKFKNELTACFQNAVDQSGRQIPAMARIRYIHALAAVRDLMQECGVNNNDLVAFDELRVALGDLDRGIKSKIFNAVASRSEAGESEAIWSVRVFLCIAVVAYQKAGLSANLGCKRAAKLIEVRKAEVSPKAKQLWTAIRRWKMDLQNGTFAHRRFPPTQALHYWSIQSEILNAQIVGLSMVARPDWQIVGDTIVGFANKKLDELSTSVFADTHHEFEKRLDRLPSVP